jgi:hypothetical protein
MMEAVRASETSVDSETTRRCIPECYHLHNCRREIMKSHKFRYYPVTTSYARQPSLLQCLCQKYGPVKCNDPRPAAADPTRFTASPPFVRSTLIIGLFRDIVPEVSARVYSGVGGGTLILAPNPQPPGNTISRPAMCPSPKLHNFLSTIVVWATSVFNITPSLLECPQIHVFHL